MLDSAVKSFIAQDELLIWKKIHVRERADPKKNRPFVADKDSTVLRLPEQISHRLGIRVAGMVQAGQSQAAFDRAQQRKVGIELSALQLVKAVVGVYDRY